MRHALALSALFLLALTASADEPSDWAAQYKVTPPGVSAPVYVKLDFMGSYWNLYDHEGVLLVTIEREDLTPAEDEEKIRIEANAAIRERYNIPRDPENHPIDGEHFSIMLGLLCWKETSSQFVVNKNPEPFSKR